MKFLKDLVPTREVCLRLLEEGVNIDTAIVWMYSETEDGNGDWKWAVCPQYDCDGKAWLEDDDGGIMYETVPAPTTDELMRFIRDVYPDAQIDSDCTWPNASWTLHHDDDEQCTGSNDDNATNRHVMALADLVMKIVEERKNRG